MLIGKFADERIENIRNQVKLSKSIKENNFQDFSNNLKKINEYSKQSLDTYNSNSIFLDNSNTLINFQTPKN